MIVSIIIEIITIIVFYIMIINNIKIVYIYNYYNFFMMIYIFIQDYNDFVKVYCYFDIVIKNRSCRNGSNVSGGNY